MSETRQYVQADGRAAIRRKRNVLKDCGPVVLMAEWVEKAMRHRRWPCVYSVVAVGPGDDMGEAGQPLAVRFSLDAESGDEQAFRAMLAASVWAVVSKCRKMRVEHVEFDGETLRLLGGYWVNDRGEVRPGPRPAPF